MLKIINLEEGLPTADRALLRLDWELAQARRQGASAVKLIHGYGSSGVGGVLRNEVQNALRRMLTDGKIRNLVIGEEWGRSNEIAWNILKLHPGLKRDSDLGKGNRGISIVIL